MQIYKLLETFPIVCMLFKGALPEKYRAVTIAQETELIGESKVIYPVPITFYKGGNQQQKCALRLMEIGHKDIYHLEFIARDNDYTGSYLNAVH